MSAPVLQLAPIIARIEAAGLYRSVAGARDMARAAREGAAGNEVTATFDLLYLRDDATNEFRITAQ